MHKVLKVTPLKNYCILAEFENGEKRIKDIKPLINRGGVFLSLKNIEIFNRVYVEYGAVTWKDNNGNEIDICPDKLYLDSVPYTERGVV
ncbi:MAG: DUF2442 domain-containing protein [Hominimerdicola sp.]